MSEHSRGLALSPERNKLGPDYFGYYKCEVVELLSQDDDLLPLASQTSGASGGRFGEVGGKGGLRHSNNESGSLFCDGIQAGLSDFKRERLQTLLRQGVKVLEPEVEKVLLNL